MIDAALSTNLLSALKSKFTAEKDVSIATLLLYVQNPVAVADHPNIIEEMATLVAVIAEAEDKIAIIDRYWGQKKSPTDAEL
jgi:hypothetical protein